MIKRDRWSFVRLMIHVDFQIYINVGGNTNRGWMRLRRPLGGGDI